MHPRNNHKGSFSTRRAQIRNAAKTHIADFFKPARWPAKIICDHFGLVTDRERKAFTEELQKIIKRIEKSTTEI